MRQFASVQSNPVLRFSLDGAFPVVYDYLPQLHDGHLIRDGNATVGSPHVLKLGEDGIIVRKMSSMTTASTHTLWLLGEYRLLLIGCG